VTGTGPDGKTTEEDVRAFFSTTGSVPAKKTVITTTPEQSEWIDLTTVQRLTGERMIQSIQTAPQFALTISVDMTHALQLREALTGKSRRKPAIAYRSRNFR
jgi:pyruvate/2-oxoglutarate dehydrogenase complex dihydrolipoamide acyltransferase (E2) component